MTAKKRPVDPANALQQAVVALCTDAMKVNAVHSKAHNYAQFIVRCSTSYDAPSTMEGIITGRVK